MSQTKAQLIDPVDGTIVNADINASAAIQGSKISPDFGSQDIVTTGGLTVDTTTLKVDASNNRVGIGTASPATQLEVKNTGNVKIYADSDGGYIQQDVSNLDVLHLISSGVIKYQSDPENDTVQTAHIFECDGSEKLRIDSNGRLAISLSTARASGGVSGMLQVERADGNGAINIVQNQNNAAGSPSLVLAKSRGTSVGSNTVVADNDTLGSVKFAGADGTDLNTPAAQIAGQVDGTPGSNDMPGRLVFSTTADGSSSLSERMRIDSSGQIGMGTTSPAENLHIRATSNVGIRLDDSGQSYGNIIYNNGSNSNDALTIAVDEGNTQDASTMRFRVDASEKIRITDSGNVGIGTTSPQRLLHSHVGSSAANYHSFTNSTTGSSATDGFLLGINSTEEAIVWNYENTPMEFATNSTERMRIGAGGDVRIGSTGSGNTRLHITAFGTSNVTGNNALRINDSSGTHLLIVRDDGLIQTGDSTASPYNLTGSTGANVFIHANSKSLRRSTSSIKYKKDIADATWGLAEVLKLRPVTFKSNGTGELADDQTYGGFTAEDVHDAGLTEFVQYNENNEPDALSYGNMVALLTNAIKELSAKVAALEAA